MKIQKLSPLVIALTIVTTTIGTANAHRNDGLDGLLLGGAGGAIVGHAINRSPEGIIVGSVIGSTLGMLIDLGLDRGHSVVIARSHRPQANLAYNNRRDNRHDRWNNRKHRRNERRWQQGRRHLRR